MRASNSCGPNTASVLDWLARTLSRFLEELRKEAQAMRLPGTIRPGSLFPPFPMRSASRQPCDQSNSALQLEFFVTQLAYRPNKIAK